MDKNAIKKYAVWARNELIARVTQKAQQYGITADDIVDANADSINGNLLTATEKKQRQALIKKIEAEGFGQVMEEVAYTWFNRFTALRFMEVNNYLPSHVRVFTNDENEFKPQILAEAINLELDGLDMDKVFELKDANKEEELYKYLLLVQCSNLGKVLPGIFSQEDSYELLFPDFLLRTDSVIDQLIKSIDEVDFNIQKEEGQVEILGWLYQYYISEKHDEVVKAIGKKVIKKNDIPAATQLFTTDWVVKYIVDNSLGRYWIENRGNSTLRTELEYYVDNEFEQKVVDINPSEIKVFDPCMGSGHFLLYAFDVLLKIYVEYGYTERDAVSEIIEKNIYGLDIDERAAQIAYFSLMMKARKYDRRVFSRKLNHNILYFCDSREVSDDVLRRFGDNRRTVEELLYAFRNAKEIGSLIKTDISLERLVQIYEQTSGLIASELNNISDILAIEEMKKEILPIVRIAIILAQKYEVVVTNPPYLNKYDKELKDYLTVFFKDYYGDLFSVFMVHNFSFCKENGYSGFMTPNVWMFIKTYEKLRKYIIEQKNIVTLVQMAKGAFFKEATVDVAAFVFSNNACKQKDGTYIRLEKYKGDMEVQRRAYLESVKNNLSNIYKTPIQTFKKIPGMPIAYWISNEFLEVFSNELLYEHSISDGQNVTSNNAVYVRNSWEVERRSVGIKKKWRLYAKGGGFRKWSGNLIDVVDWSPSAIEFYHKESSARVLPEYLWYRLGITWGLITSSVPSFRKLPQEATFDKGGSSIFLKNDKDFQYFIGLLNSKVFLEIVQMLNPTLNFQVRDIRSVPVKIEDKEEITKLVDECISISDDDWNQNEVSWDFKNDPLVAHGENLIEVAYNRYYQECCDRFDRLKYLEEELNKRYIRIYGLEDELDYRVNDSNVSVSRPSAEECVKNLISYSVGCMVGRYSLDESGVCCATRELDISKYNVMLPDDDNIIPICEDEYFLDDIVARFVEFIKITFGTENLEQNLSYVANVLGRNGSSREGIRNYFINDFYKDHCALFSGNSGKKPIYWLFDSGKKNGFKALVYMHRYQPDTIARIRTDYVHEQQSRYRTEIVDLEQRIIAADTGEKVKLNKRLKKVSDQAEELRLYEEKIHHLADQMIDIDLDDGVKVNYAKFQDVLAKIK